MCLSLKEKLQLVIANLYRRYTVLDRSSILHVQKIKKNKDNILTQILFPLIQIIPSK